MSSKLREDRQKQDGVAACRIRDGTRSGPSSKRHSSTEDRQKSCNSITFAEFSVKTTAFETPAKAPSPVTSASTHSSHFGGILTLELDKVLAGGFLKKRRVAVCAYEQSGVKSLTELEFVQMQKSFLSTAKYMNDMDSDGFM